MAPFVGGLARGFPRGRGEEEPSHLSLSLRKTRAAQPIQQGDPYIVQSKHNRYARGAMK